MSRVWQAVILVSLVGICWAVACWAPFAIIMEFLKEREDGAAGAQAAEAQRPAPVPVRTLSTSSRRGTANANAERGERAPLLRRAASEDSYEEPEVEAAAGGTILGIHNLAIVMPQFVVSTFRALSCCPETSY